MKMNIYLYVFNREVTEVAEGGSSEKDKKEKKSFTKTYKSLEDSLQKTWKDARRKDLRRMSSLGYLIHSKFISY
jgi:hypothetical protein